MNRTGPDRRAALASYSRLAARYDDRCAWLEGARYAALEALGVSEGETVIDVGCGTGAMLTLMGRAVGSNGHVIGIEQSPEMAALARERVALAGLRNIEILECAVEEARLTREADALLFFYVHDVLQSDQAISRVLGCARHGARVIAAGVQLAGWWAAPLNVWKLWRSRRYVSTYAGLRDPASRLRSRCPDWRVFRKRALGTSYVAVGHLEG
ncbi:MAG: class I SAM-dependent methyltransferase [Betaproteobacteria bacterium]